jgi:predicted secreted protein
METQTIRARAGEPVEIRRVAGFGGGYIWRARLLNESSGTIAEVEATKGKTADDNMPGSPLVQTFVFQSKKSGIYKLELSYGRPWETAPLKTEVIRIEVS